jgi:hypothetical protein
MTRPAAPVYAKPRGYQRRERLLARWRLSTILAAVVALGAVGAVLAAGLSLGGFGVPTDSSPRVINPKDVPFGLLGKESPTSVTATAPHPHFSQPEILWFIGTDGKLAPAAAAVANPVSIASILDALLAGPSSTASVQTTEIPTGTQLLSARVSAGLVTIDLSSDIEEASGEPLIQAFAQLVFTATPDSCPVPPPKNRQKSRSPLPPTTTTSTPKGQTPLPCTDRVLFEVNGTRLQVPIENGAQTGRPITRADYASLSS